LRTRTSAQEPPAQSSTFEEEITPERLRAFRTAIGLTAGSHEVPPTYLTRFRQGEFELLERLGVPLQNVLHAEQDYQYFAPLRPGMKILYETVLANSFEKKGRAGSLHFLVTETRVRWAGSADPQPLVVCKTTIVAKGKTP